LLTRTRKNDEVPQAAEKLTAEAVHAARGQPLEAAAGAEATGPEAVAVRAVEHLAEPHATKPEAVRATAEAKGQAPKAAE